MSRRFFATIPFYLLILALILMPLLPVGAVDYDVTVKTATDQRVFHDTTPSYPTSGYEADTRLLGHSAAMGDFSGDGQDDVILGSPLSEANPAAGTVSDHEGVVFYYKGPINDTTPNTNEYYNVGFLGTDGSGIILGRYAKDHLGFAVGLGDVNGDTTKDLVIGASSGNADTGEVYVLFSTGGFINPSDTGTDVDKSILFLNKSAERADVDIIISGINGAGFNGTDTSGIALAVGDVSGDGLADIIIGAPHYNSNRGAVYIVIGQNVSPLSINVATPANNVVYRIDGGAAGDKLGSSVAVADVCGGSRKDIIMGAPGASSSAGKVYVLQGAALGTWNAGWAAGTSILDIATESASLATTISGASAGYEFGRAVFGANVNGTSGFSDIIAGEPLGGTSQAGNVYVFAGTTTLTTTMTTAAASMKVIAPNTGENLGASLHAADWNGDNIADILAGAPTALDVTNTPTNPTGRAYMIPGASSLPAIFDLTIPSNLSSCFVVYGETVGGRMGTAMASGFLSNRSSRDMLITASEGMDSNQSMASGAAYNVYYVRGPNAPTGVTVLDTPTRDPDQTFIWTHDDPQLLPQIKYQAQFAKDTGFTTALQESGEVTSGAMTWGTTLTGGDGIYYYRVRTANVANFGPWSNTGSFILDTGAPTIAESTTWDGGTHNTNAARTVTLLASDTTDSPAATLEVWVWRSRQAGEDLNNNGVCDSGEGVAQTLNTASPVGSTRSFSLTINDTAVLAGENVRLWVGGNDRAGNTYAAKNAFNDNVVAWTVQSPLGPVASGFNPALPSPDAVYVNTASPTIELTLIDEDVTVDTSSVDISFQGTTIAVGLTPAEPLWFNPATDILVYRTPGGTSYGNGTFTVILAAADDANGNPLQNPTRWEFVIDTTPPSSVNDDYSVNGGFYPLDSARAIRATVVDNLRANSQLTMYYWRSGVDDNGASPNDGVIDDDEIRNVIINNGSPGLPSLTFDTTINESSMISQGTVSIWFGGTDHAGNAISAGVGGSKTNPLIYYSVYDTAGPTVVGWNPVKPAYFNAVKPTFQFTVNDLDAGVDTSNLVFQVNATEYRVTDPTPALTVNTVGQDSTFTYASKINYPEGTMTVWIKSAKDMYGNFIAGSEDTYGVHFVDVTGPYAVDGSESPANGSSTSNQETAISFTVKDDLSGLNLDALELTLDYINAGSQNEVLDMTDPRLTWSNGVLTFLPGTPGYFEDGNVTVTLTAVSDIAGNPGQQTNWTFGFVVNTSGPQASNLYPVDGLITRSSTQEVRVTITSGGSTVDTDSIVLNVAGVDYTPASAALTWDSVLNRLTFKPVSDGITYSNGTVSISLKSASDISAFTLQDAPVKWSFIVDTAGPVMVSKVGSYLRLPTSEVWVTDNLALLKFGFEDNPAAAGFNSGTLNFKINNQTPGYGSASAGVTVTQEVVDANTSGLRVVFNPTNQGITLPQGTVSVAVTALADIAGNTLVTSGLENWSFRVDSVKPVVINAAPSGYLTSGNQTVILSLSEATSGIDTASIVLSIDGGTVGGWSLVGTDLMYTPPTVFADGTTDVSLYLKDNAGNDLESVGADHAFVVDTAPPYVVGGEQPLAGGYATSLRQDIYLSVDDLTSGINPNTGGMTFQVKDGTGAFLPGTLVWNNGLKRIEWTPSVDYPEGTITVTLSSIPDRAGLDLASPYSWVFNVDRSGPVASDMRPVEGEFVRNRRRTVEVSLTDNLAGVNSGSIQLDVDGYLYSVGLNLGWNSTLGKLTFVPPYDYPDGTVTVTLTQAMDTQGQNYTSVPFPLKVSFLVDAASPIASFVAPTGTVTSNSPVEATVADIGFGMDTASISFIISAEMAGQLYTGSVDDNIITYDGTSLIFYPALAGVTYPNDTITVSIVGADRFGNQLNNGVALEHVFLKDNTGPYIVTSPIDTRTPGPNTQPYSADTTEVIRFQLVDLPSGVDPATILVSVYTQDLGGITAENQLTTASPHLSYDQATGWVTYDPAPDQNYPTVSQVTVKLLQAKDKSQLAINTNPAAPDHTWSFDVNNSFTIASNADPAKKEWINDRLQTVSIELHNDGGIDASSIVFLAWDGVVMKTREVGVYSTHSLVYDPQTEILSYTPTLATRYPEGTVDVALTRALDTSGLSDLPGPFITRFYVDSQAPIAIPQFPLADQAISDARATIEIKLTDIGGGVEILGTERISLKIKTPADTDWVTYRISTSPFVAYDGTTLTFNSTHTYVFPEGMTSVRLEQAKDLAGNVYAGFPLEYNFSVNTVNPTLTAWTPGDGDVVTDASTPLQFTIDTGLGSGGVDTATIKLAIKNNAGATLEVDITDTRLTWDGPSKTLTYIPSSNYDEGTVSVALLTLSDLEGHTYDADFLPFGYSFLVDLTAPVINVSGVTPLAPGWATINNQAITIPVNDGISGSGIDLSTVGLEISYPGSGGTFSVGIGDNLTWDGANLIFTPSVPMQEGTATVWIQSLRDRANLAATPMPWGFYFGVDLYPPEAEDLTRLPVAGGAVKATQEIRIQLTDTSSGIDPTTLQLNVLGTTWAGGSARLSYDPLTNWLVYDHQAGFAEGSVTVVLLAGTDRAGWPVTGDPSGIPIPLYAWDFMVDSTPPTVANPVPQSGSYKDDPGLNIFLQLKDTLSGVDTWSVTLLDGSSNPIPFSETFTRSSGVLKIDPTANLPSGAITVRVDLYDRAGNRLTGAPYSWQFHIDVDGPVVNMVTPTADSRTRNNLTDLNFSVDDSGEVVASTIRLTVQPSTGSSNVYTTSSGQLTWASPDLTFSPGVAVWPDGTVHVFLEMRDTLNHPIAGTSNWSFVVDTRGPKVTPAVDAVPAPAAISDSLTREIDIRIVDTLGTVDEASISLKVTNSGLTAFFGSDNQTWNTTAPGLTWTSATGILKLVPVDQGFAYETGEVTVSLLQAKDDLGNDLQGLPVTWTFTIVDDQPFVQSTNPIDGGYTKDIAQDIQINLFLPQSTTLKSDSVEIYLDWGGGQQTLGVNLTTSPWADPGLTWDAASNRLTLVPENVATAISFPEGPVAVNVTGIVNSLGKTMPGDHLFTFIVDTTEPTLSNPSPTGYVSNDQAAITILVTDGGGNAGDRIDPATISMRLESGTQSVLFAAGNSGISYDPLQSRVIFQPISATPAFRFSEGSVAVTIMTLADRAGNGITSTWSYGFTLDREGPLPSTWSPDKTILADAGETLEIRFTSVGESIDPATLLMTIYNNALVRTFNGLEPGVTADVGAGWIYLHPATAGLVLTEGTVSVEVLSLADQVGNPLVSALSGSDWEWFLDLTGPDVVEKYPAGAVSSDRQQAVYFRIDDLYSDVELSSMRMDLAWWNGPTQAGTHSVTFTSPGVQTATQTDGVILFHFDPKFANPAIQFSEGTLQVVLSAVRDVLGNTLSPLADQTMEILINTEGPMLSVPDPVPGTVMGAAPGTISVTLQPTLAGATVVSSSIGVKFYGVEYLASNYPTAIRYIAPNLYVHPSSIPLAMRDGPVTFEVSRAKDSYGNNLKPSTDPDIGADNAWTFTVDLTGPSASTPLPADNSIIGGGGTPEIQLTIRDFWSAVDTTSVILRLTTGLGIFNLPVDDWDPVTGLTTFRLADHGAALTSGRNDLTLTTADDVHGHPLQAPLYFAYTRDAEGPEPKDPYPVANSTVRNRETWVSLRLVDALSGIDSTTISMSITNGTLSVTLAPGDAGLSYAGGVLLFNPVSAGLLFNEGMVSVTLASGLADTLGNVRGTPYTWSFTVVSRGPYAATPSPADGAVVSDPLTPVRLTVKSEISSIVPGTLRLQIMGQVWNTDNPALSYVNDILQFDPAVAGLRYPEGSIAVTLTAAQDLAGNPLEGGAFSWSFLVDSEGPEATLGVGPVSADRPTDLAFSLHFRESLISAPTLFVTDGRGSEETLLLSAMAGTTTVWLKQTNAAQLLPPLSFTYSASDLLGNSFTRHALTTTLATTSVLTGQSLLPNRWYLLGVPSSGPIRSREVTLSGLPATGSFGFYQLNRSIFQFDTTEVTGPGFGYAFRHQAAGNVAPTVSGWLLDNPRLNFRFALTPGWNLVSLPWFYRIRVASLLVDFAGAEKLLADPLQTVVEPVLFGYGIDSTSGLGGFEPYASTSDLEAWRGYFIYARDTAELLIPPVFLTAAELNARPVPQVGLQKPAGSNGFLLKISARDGLARDDWNTFGMLDNPAGFTLRKPPVSAFTPWISLAFREDGNSETWSSRVKATGVSRETWLFRTTSDRVGQEIILSWIPPVFSGSDRLVLTDLSTGASISMRSASEYRFVNQGAREFRVVWSLGEDTIPTGGSADTVKPEVLNWTPRGLDVAPGSLVRASFSEAIDPATVGSAVSLQNLYAGGFITGQTVYDKARHELIFRPSQPLVSGDYYRVTLQSSILDLARNSLDTFQWNFRVAAASVDETEWRQTFGPGWQLAGFPRFPVDGWLGTIIPTATSGFAAYQYQNGDYRIFNSNDPDSVDPVEPGIGFWLKFNATTEVVVLGKKATGTTYRIPLNAKDWNQFSHPFEGKVAWNNVRIDTGTSEMTISAAATSGYILPSVYRWRNNALTSFTAPAGDLEAGDGYFLYSHAGVTLIVPAPAAGAPARAPQRPLEPHYTWYVRVSMAGDGLLDEDNIAGVDSVAVDGFDLQDVPELEPPAPCAFLRFLAHEGAFTALSRDIRAPRLEETGILAETMVYPFEVVQRGRDVLDAVLRFDPRRLPDGWQAVVVDQLTGERLDVTTGGELRIRSYEPVRSFRLEIGRQ